MWRSAAAIRHYPKGKTKTYPKGKTKTWNDDLKLLARRGVAVFESKRTKHRKLLCRVFDRGLRRNAGNVEAKRAMEDVPVVQTKCRVRAAKVTGELEGQLQHQKKEEVERPPQLGRWDPVWWHCRTIGQHRAWGLGEPEVLRRWEDYQLPAASVVVFRAETLQS
eukprot:4206608-Amphidinium_carterae.1